VSLRKAFLSSTKVPHVGRKNSIVIANNLKVVSEIMTIINIGLYFVAANNCQAKYLIIIIIIIIIIITVTVYIFQCKNT
jgi:hypothetical protein